jgi:hypothetical protein
LFEFETADPSDNLADPVNRLQVEPGAHIFTPEGVGLEFLVGLGMDVSGAHLNAGSGLNSGDSLVILATAGGATITNNSVLRGANVLVRGALSPANITVDHSSRWITRPLRQLPI